MCHKNGFSLRDHSVQSSRVNIQRTNTSAACVAELLLESQPLQHAELGFGSQELFAGTCGLSESIAV